MTSLPFSKYVGCDGEFDGIVRWIPFNMLEAKMYPPILSVVVPVYGCRECIVELCRRIDAAVAPNISVDYEIVLVNDASPDLAWPTIQKLAANDSRIRGINLSRNFGQHCAITAGLDQSRGTWVVVMDCDLQDQPEEIPKLYSAAQDGYDVVVGIRQHRRDTLFKRATSRLFYRIFDYFTGTNVQNSIANFGIYSRRAVEGICMLREQHRSFGLFAIWVGFRRLEIPVAHAQREIGETSYTFRKLMHLAMDSILAHSNTLLWISVKLGLLISIASLLLGIWLIVRYLTWGVPLVGWTSLMVTIFFSTGLIIGCIGIMGLYIGKIFDEVKGRPLYIIASTTYEADRQLPIKQ